MGDFKGVNQAFNSPLGQQLIADTLNSIENCIATKVSTMILGRGRDQWGNSDAFFVQERTIRPLR